MKMDNLITKMQREFDEKKVLAKQTAIVQNAFFSYQTNDGQIHLTNNIIKNDEDLVCWVKMVEDITYLVEKEGGKALTAFIANIAECLDFESEQAILQIEKRKKRRSKVLITYTLQKNGFQIYENEVIDLDRFSNWTIEDFIESVDKHVQREAYIMKYDYNVDYVLGFARFV